MNCLRIKSLWISAFLVFSAYYSIPANAACDPAIDSLMGDYLNAYTTADVEGRGILLNQIRERVFSRASTPQYEQDLTCLDRYSAVNPEALFDLAKFLQYRWGHLYGASFMQERKSQKKMTVQAGMMLGLSALAVASFSNPKAVPLWFKMLRQALPMAGVSFGQRLASESGRASSSQGIRVAPPAQFMRLGMMEVAGESEGALDIQMEGFIKDWVSITAATGGTFASAELIASALQLMNRVSSVGKWNPWVLGGSLLLGFILEEGAEAAIDLKRTQAFRQKLLDARDQVWIARQRGDRGELYVAAAKFTQSAINLARYSNFEVLREMAKNQPDGNQLKKLKGRIPLDADFVSAWALRSNLEEGESSDLGFEGQRMKNGYLLASTHKIRSLEDQMAMTLDLASRKSIISDDTREALDSQQNRLSLEVVNGQIARYADPILLQSAAFLRGIRNEFVDGNAEFLESLVFGNVLQGHESRGG